MATFVLVDGRRPERSDIETMKLLDKCAVSYAIVLTKRDEVKPTEREARVEETLAALCAAHPAAYPGTFFTSSRTGEGIPRLHSHIGAIDARTRRGGEGLAARPSPLRGKVAFA